MFEYYSLFVTRHARKILWALTAITLVMGFCVFRLRTDNSIETWLLDDDPRRLSYKQFAQTFGTEEFVLVVFSDTHMFSKESFQRINRLSEKLKAAPGIDRVLSLSEAYREIISNLPLGASLSVEQFENRVVGHPLFTGNLISKDGLTTAVVAVLNREGVKNRRKTVRTIRTVAANACPDIDMRFAGPPVISAELDRIAGRDPRLFTPIVALITSGILLALFRSLTGVRLPMAAAGMSIVWALGVFALIGGTMNLVLAVMPPLILVAAVGDSIHLLCRYQHYAQQEEAPASIVKAVRDVWKPCLMTSLTTAVGFGSLAISRFSPVRNFGLLSILGIVFAFVISMLMIPASIAYKGSAGLGRAFEGRGSMSGILPFIDKVNRKHSGIVLLLFAAVTAVGMAGTLWLHAEANTLKFFPPRSELRQTYDFIESHFTGLSPFEILLSGRELDSPATMAAIDSIQEHLSKLSCVTHSFSIRALQANFKPPHTLPPASTGLKIPALFGRLKHSFLSSDGTMTHISGRGLTMNSLLYEKAMDEIESYTKSVVPPGVSAELTGIVPMITSMDRYLLVTFIKSFGIAIVSIGTIMAFNFRSIRTGLVSMIPNIVPIVATLGLMGFLRIDLSPATVTVAAIALGIAVDDTIHYTHSYFQRLRNGDDRRTAASAATGSIGRPMIYTTLTLALGFSVMALSDFGPTRNFGLLSAICILLALLCDLFLLPVLLTRLGPWLRVGSQSTEFSEKPTVEERLNAS